MQREDTGQANVTNTLRHEVRRDNVLFLRIDLLEKGE